MAAGKPALLASYRLWQRSLVRLAKANSGRACATSNAPPRSPTAAAARRPNHVRCRYMTPMWFCFVVLQWRPPIIQIRKRIGSGTPSSH